MSKLNILLYTINETNVLLQNASKKLNIIIPMKLVFPLAISNKISYSKHIFIFFLILNY